jgi:hypothetical protein
VGNENTFPFVSATSKSINKVDFIERGQYIDGWKRKVKATPKANCRNGHGMDAYAYARPGGR